MAACIAEKPLLPCLVPQRSTACSRLSAETTPSITGTPDETEISVKAFAVAWLMRSAWAVAPCTTAPRHTIASGFVAGIVYDLMSRKNKSVAVILAAITAPVVNTAIFFGGCFAFFYDLISSWAEGGSIVWFVLTVMIGINFLIELLINTVFSPMIAKLIELGKK